MFNFIKNDHAFPEGLPHSASAPADSSEPPRRTPQDPGWSACVTHHPRAAVVLPQTYLVTSSADQLLCTWFPSAHLL